MKEREVRQRLPVSSSTGRGPLLASSLDLRTVVLGCESSLGSALTRALARQGDVYPVSCLSTEVEDPASLIRVLRDLKPAVVFNAIHEMPLAEAEAEPEKANQRLVLFPRIIAEEVRRLRGTLIHYSSYNVFDGHKSSPYSEDDRPAPLNELGRSQLEGELRIKETGCCFLVFRLGWLYSASSLRNISDEFAFSPRQHGTPSWVDAVAVASADTLQTIRCMGLPDSETGIYHMAGRGEITWGGFLRAATGNSPESAAAMRGKNGPAHSVPGKNPLNAMLDASKLFRTFGVRLPHWKKQLDTALYSQLKGPNRSHLPSRSERRIIAV